MPRSIPIPKKKRMNVLDEHKTVLSESNINPRFIKKLEVGNPDSALCSKSLYIGKIYLKENGRVIPKKVVIKELDLDRNYYRMPTGNAETVIKEIKNYIIKKQLELTPETIAKSYNETIIELRKSGIEIPKMIAIVKDNKVLLISQFFGNKTGKKITKETIELFLLGSKRNQLIDLYAKTINKGFFPTLDFIEVMKTKTGKLEVLPIDIDQQVLFYLKYGKINKIRNKKIQEELVTDLTRHFFRKLGQIFPKEKTKEARKTINEVVKRINVNYIKKDLIQKIKKDVFLKYLIYKTKM